MVICKPFGKHWQTIILLIWGLLVALSLRAIPITERLDRGTCSQAWQAEVGFSRVVNLFPSRSDHVPLLLEVEEAWGIPQIRDPMLRLCHKIKGVGGDLLEWDRIVFQSRRQEVESVRSQLNDLLQKPFDQNDIEVKQQLTRRLNELMSIDETYWRQRSRAIWLKDGDRNSRFFHKRASNRHQKNKIKGLFNDNGVWQDSKQGIESVVLDYFQSIFSSQVLDLDAQNLVLQTIGGGGQEGFLALKLDISKAYDRLEWVFLQKIMLKVGFVVAWVELIMFCLSTVRYSFLINEVPRGYVTQQRRLRQGDPIFPYLFLPCAEGLSALISHAVSFGQWQGLRICDGAPIISHLLFADDSMKYFNATSQDCSIIRDLLNIYEKAWGQQVNLHKSNVVFSGSMQPHLCVNLARILGVQVVDKHEKYLGIRTLVGRSKSDTFAYIKDKGKFYEWYPK
ncbi:uncharacterized protein LOC133737377 [Rosa rugosa]|uniref:uncharacterized protein LOC133737377 n=1 Tax=Rosa rugosa TaxID=74645 RepID=UPI002B401EF6|nr:uncharacterized protein LOC133737377 [Rosa rugosa]